MILSSFFKNSSLTNLRKISRVFSDSYVLNLARDG
jgi:hypothetical protein